MSKVKGAHDPNYSYGGGNGVQFTVKFQPAVHYTQSQQTE